MKKSKFSSDAITQAVIYLILGILGVIMLYPIIVVVSNSFSNPRSIMQGKVLFLPVEPTLRSYANILKNERIVGGFLNSIKYTLLGTTLNIVLTICAAYPLSRKDLVGRNFFMKLLLFCMFFSGGRIMAQVVFSRPNPRTTR